jgi:thiol peroxidase
LLARTALVIDRQGKIAYKELVGEIVDEPDYQAALAAVKKLL